MDRYSVNSEEEREGLQSAIDKYTENGVYPDRINAIFLIFWICSAKKKGCYIIGVKIKFSILLIHPLLFLK